MDFKVEEKNMIRRLTGFVATLICLVPLIAWTTPLKKETAKTDFGYNPELSVSENSVTIGELRKWINTL